MEAATRSFCFKGVHLKLGKVGRVCLSSFFSDLSLSPKDKKGKNNRCIYLSSLDGPVLLSVVYGTFLRKTTASTIAALSLLASPLNDPQPLLRTGGLPKAVWKISGDVISYRNLRRKWSSFSWKDSTQALSQLTNRQGAIGCVFAWREVKIPFHLIEAPPHNLSIQLCGVPTNLFCILPR